jgi:hypothetical protein
LLKKQQRLQYHHRRNLPIDQVSQDSQSSSPLDTPSVNSIGNHTQFFTTSTAENTDEYEWRRVLVLRRVLSEHTAFNQENPHPAPITAIAPSKYATLLV